jgi:hypothetical protein
MERMKEPGVVAGSSGVGMFLTSRVYLEFLAIVGSP